MSNSDKGRPTLIDPHSMEGMRIEVRVDREVRSEFGLNCIELSDMTLQQKSAYGRLFIDRLGAAGVDCASAKREQATKAAARCREHGEHELAATWDEIAKGTLN